MKVLEERLTYLFVVFCKDLLCLPNWILAQGLSFVRSHFSFPSLPLLVLKFHMQFNSFDSQAAHILDLWVICLSALAILFDRSFFHSTLGWDSLVFNMVVTFLSLLHAMQLSFLHNGALHVTNWPEWVVGAIWSNGLIKVDRTKPGSTVRQTIQQMKSGSAFGIGNETRSVGRFECVFIFWRLFLLAFAWSRFYLNKWKSLKKN